MNAFVCVFGLATLAAPTTATAAAASNWRQCYAGTEELDGKTSAVVIVHEYDRVAATIRRRAWNASEPWREAGFILHVAPGGQTFELKSRVVEGSGTFEGKPWEWTGYRAEATVNDARMTAEAKFASDTTTLTSRLESGGKIFSKRRIEAKAFPCEELERRRAALDDTVPDAVRACYDGSETLLGETKRALLQQILEPHRIRTLRWRAGQSSPAVRSMAIDGTTITVTAPNRSWIGRGELIGKPGAWTGYRWTTHLDTGVGAGDVLEEGTLGGAHATQKSVTQNARSVSTTTLSATAFECTDWAKRLATLQAEPR